jgi:hypothetical protein
VHVLIILLVLVFLAAVLAFNGAVALVWVAVVATVLAVATPRELEERRWAWVASLTAACTAWALCVEVLATLTHGLEATFWGVPTDRFFPERTLDALGWAVVLWLGGFGWRRALGSTGVLSGLGMLSAAIGFGFLGVAEVIYQVYLLGDMHPTSGIVDLVDYRDGYCALLDSGEVACRNTLDWPEPASWPTDPEERVVADEHCHSEADLLICGAVAPCRVGCEHAFAVPSGATVVDVRVDVRGGCALLDDGTFCCCCYLQ